MTIDTERLKTDAAYWDKCGAPEGATHLDLDFDYFCNEKGFWNNSMEWRSTPHGHADWGSGRYIPRPTKPAAPEPMSDDCLAAKIGEIGNQIHNLGCNNQNDEDLSGRLGELAIALWDLAKDAPTDSAAPEWDGKTWPVPVGEVCEIIFMSGSFESYGEKAEAIVQDGDVTVFRANGVYYGIEDIGRLRPIRTPEQRQREELSAIIDEWVGARSCNIADAILSHYNLEPKK